MKYSSATDELWIKSNAIALSISAIAFCDMRGKIIYVNKAFLSLWRYDDETEVTGRNASDFWRTEEYHGTAGRTLKEKGGWIGEIVAVKKDGVEFPVQISISLLTGTDNRPVCYAASFIDITERAAAQREQALVVRQLAERVKELDCILSIVACQRLQAGSLDALLRTIISLVRSSMQWPERACVRISVGAVEVATDNFAASDSTVHIPLGSEPDDCIDIGYTAGDDTPAILDEEKKLFSAVAHEIESIIEQRRIENELRVNRERLLQADKLASIGVLSAGIVHEIGNPNNFIAMNARILSKAWKSIFPILESYHEENGDFSVAGLSYNEARAEIPRLMEGILDGSDRIGKLGARLKSFAKSSLRDAAEEIDVNSVITHALVFVQNLIDTNVRRFSTHLGASLPTVRGDPVQIEQVVINIVTNACQALSRDDGAITISTAAGENHDVVEVIVEDNGVGIDEEEIPRLIDPFYSTKSEAGGTGLGLSVSNYIVTRHNGTMTITSTVGKGTRVKLTFPGARSA
jgi:PAS domain S-box-containing protein